MTSILEIADLKRIAKRKVPKLFFDYADSGSWTESTYRTNESDFQKLLLRQKIAVDMTNRSLKSTMIGQDVALPIAMAPTGLTGMQCADGEIKAAKACEGGRYPLYLVDHEYLLD